jgi:hypothetical protein
LCITFLNLIVVYHAFNVIPWARHGYIEIHGLYILDYSIIALIRAKLLGMGLYLKVTQIKEPHYIYIYIIHFNFLLKMFSLVGGVT